jgi:hypothetical protein
MDPDLIERISQNDPKIKRIEFDGDPEFTIESLTVLTSALHNNTHVNQLWFHMNVFGDEMVEVLVDFLIDNSTIQTFQVYQ